MHAAGRQPQWPPDSALLHYKRHLSEQTALYQLVQQQIASFIAYTEASTVTGLPRFIKHELDAFLECRILAHGLRCGCSCEEERRCRSRGAHRFEYAMSIAK